MERGFYNEDFNFEELVKRKSDQYRMYPTETVWKGIYGNLHTKRRWYLTGLFLFLGAAGYLSTEKFLLPQKQLQLSQDQPVQSPAAPRAATGPSTPQSSASPVGNVALETSEKVSLNDPEVTPLTHNAGQRTPLAYTPIALSGFAPISMDTRSEPQPVEVKPQFNRSYLSKKYLASSPNLTIPASRLALNQHLTIPPSATAITPQQQWLQENVVNALSQPKAKRVSWQISVTPTMNYRKLVGADFVNLASDVNNIPIALNFSGNINNLVKHKPAMGFEVGSMFLYALNKKVSFKTGVQFNYSSYDIRAYSTSMTERATISLFNYSGVGELTSYTRLRNFGGSAVKELKNEFYDLTAPIGLEWVVVGNRKLQLAVAGTLQPTYHLNRNNYLITTDYKNYTKAPSLVRRWNMNSSAEAFIAYKSKGLKFQLGPQIRHQFLSTYRDKYPVKEYLLEYGLKFAVTREVR